MTEILWGGGIGKSSSLPEWIDYMPADWRVAAEKALDSVATPELQSVVWASGVFFFYCINFILRSIIIIIVLVN